MVLNVIPFVHQLLLNTVTNEGIVIDATCGNGNDTLFLAKHAKHVYAFDIQEQAIATTKSLLEANHMTNVTMILSSHEYIKEHVNTTIQAATFNLGYLPRSDKSIQTKATSTIKAIADCIDLLSFGGIITLILYIGHEGGKQEANAVEDFCKALDKQLFKVIRYSFINRENAPYVIIIEKQHKTLC